MDWDALAALIRERTVDVVIGLIVVLIGGVLGGVFLRWAYWPYAAVLGTALVGVLLLGAFALPWANAEVAKNLGAATPPPVVEASVRDTQPPVYVVAVQIVSKALGNGHYDMAARIVLQNDAEEGQIEFTAAEALGMSADDEQKRFENITQVRAMAEQPPDRIGMFVLNRKGLSTIAETAPLRVTKAAYEQYMAGKATFYFAGKMVYKIGDKTWTHPFCGFSPGDPNKVLQCP